MLPVPPSLHDFSSPQASGSGSSFPLTPDSATSTVTAGPSNPPSTAGTDRHSPPSPPPSQPANSHQTTTTHSGAPGRGRGAKRGTKPGAKRGEWRVKNYTGGNTSATGEQMQPADPSTYSSFFKVAPPTTPVPEPEPPSFVQNGNGNYQIASSSNVASSSNLRLQVPSEVSPGMQVSSRSTSSREHSSDGDDFGNGVTDFNQYDPPTSPQPPDNMDTDSTGPPKRLVALVIEDKRYGDSDLQLVEVTIPVLTSSDGSVWVEAENVCAMLQKGPSRIDGPAKVFTYRGKLRQYFLRVSNDNHDTYGPANLTINHRRVLKVFVEASPEGCSTSKDCRNGPRGI
ncbi:hypothetical protein SCHPADRAFT_124060 [Schizopora paradoxa]|uniref:Uncharacterized protein n=1 Tax=Schizopora paradoxa TaxID=27342 RepID=A0A0H2S9Q3_9AGAM|nr:hypothetical protein SCHPADRAFT_124060 [Schizopora paradoxa]